MRTTLLFAAATLIPLAAAHAEEAGGSCAGTPPEFSIFEDLGDVLPDPGPARFVAEPHQRVTVCGEAPVVALDETLRRADITVRIPLGSLDVRPMTAEAFGKAIRDVDVPELWSMDGTTEWKLDGDTLVVTVKNGSTSAASGWVQMPGFLGIRTEAGQNVVVEVSSPAITVDETKKNLDDLRGREKYIGEMLTFQKERLETAKKRIADPSTITTGNDEFLRDREASLARNTATVEAMRPRLREELANADVGTLSSAYTHMIHDLPASQQAALEAQRAKLIPASNEKVRADARANSDRAVLADLEKAAAEHPGSNWAAHIAEWTERVRVADEAAAAAAATLSSVKGELHAAALAAGGEDLLLETIDDLNPQGESRYGAAFRGMAHDTKSIAETKAMIARERAAKLAQEKKAKEQILAEIKALETELPTVRKRIAGGETVIRTMKTSYPAHLAVSCPAS